MLWSTAGLDSGRGGAGEGRARRQWVSRNCGEGLPACCWDARCSTLESGTADGLSLGLLRLPLGDRHDDQDLARVVKVGLRSAPQGPERCEGYGAVGDAAGGSGGCTLLHSSSQRVRHIEHSGIVDGVGSQ